MERFGQTPAAADLFDMSASPVVTSSFLVRRPSPNVVVLICHHYCKVYNAVQFKLSLTHHLNLAGPLTSY
jgi:hypothetical protein